MSGMIDSGSAPAVLVESGPRITIVRLNRPAARNSLNVATLEELHDAVSALAVRGDAEAIIFTGTSDVFASGADIRELRALTPATALEFARRGQSLMRVVANAPQPTIAAINGYCMGGGLDLALACRFRIASTAAVFAHPGARLGIITGWGGTQRLPRLIGQARALEMFATGRRLKSDEALATGLVDLVADSVLDRAGELAERLLASAEM